MKSTRRLLGLAQKLGKRVHILHVTTAEEVEIIGAHKDVATMEACPQHLTFAAPEIYERLKGFAQMNPPIREARHREGLWRGVVQGVVDVIATDHAPHTIEEKEKPYPASPSGMPGVQTVVPVMLTHVAEGRLTLERLVDLMAHGPNRIFGAACKGRLAVGYDADLTIVDLKARRTITNAQMANRSGWTPFDGFEAKGWPMATVIRGAVVMRDDEVVAPASASRCASWRRSARPRRTGRGRPAVRAGCGRCGCPRPVPHRRRCGRRPAARAAQARDHLAAAPSAAGRARTATVRGGAR